MSRRSHGEHDALVGEYSHEKHRQREKEALHTLRKIASLVKPIMRGRAWKVGTLAEFYPDQTNLLGLNINRGQKICLRLRYPGDQNQFLPLEQVVDTMLHELCHNVIGPHNAEFNALWDQLRREYESLLSKGYTGEGFLSEGHRLGGRTMPKEEVRRQARAAAERRKVLNAGSGQRLGGAGIRPGQDVRQVIVNAIERRNTVLSGCGSGNKDSQRIEKAADKEIQTGFKTKAEEDTANDQAIAEALWEMIQEEERELQRSTSNVPVTQPSSNTPVFRPPPETSHPPPIPFASKPAASNVTAPPRSSHPVSRLVVEAEEKALRKVKSNKGKTMDGRTPSMKSAPAVASPAPKADIWECSICTCHNPWNFLCCDACGTERPDDSQTRAETVPQVEKQRPSKSTGDLGFWICQRCETVMESQWWTCSACGLMKASS